MAAASVTLTSSRARFRSGSLYSTASDGHSVEYRTSGAALDTRTSSSSCCWDSSGSGTASVSWISSGWSISFDHSPCPAPPPCESAHHYGGGTGQGRLSDNGDVSEVRPEVPAAPPAPASGQAPVPAPQEQQVKPILTAKQAKRANQTFKGMVISVLLTIAVAIPVVLMNPGSKPETYQRNTDVAAVALEAEPAAGYLPVVPPLPGGWPSNYARWSSGGTGAVPAWEAGYLTGGGHHIALTQTSKANPTWIAQATGGAPVTGQRRIGGADWELRDSGAGPRSLVLEQSGYTVILKGEADLAEFDALGAAVADDLRGR
ncbi:DUF4245 domain-containing protein [Arthrobacter deserti]|uniref:DUF4245 domain-containing protein n=1 Tax=Arthrobacter deserti TaxID=1742687 RepID=A0ABX1JMD3_9MICC|nr:DUF4245 domain-containing protein [Arthrobacter deserti]